MVKCSKCERPAVYINRANNMAYCKQHFIDYFEKKVRKTISKYRMFSKNEHIIVATSGGKDSLSLLHVLLKLARRNPSWHVTALLIDEGIKGYREKTVENLVKYAERSGVDYRIVTFREFVGATLDEIVGKSRELGLPYMPCSYCGVFRRYIMNVASKELGGTALATAHNLDDVVQTFLMNLFENGWDRIAKLTPVIEPPDPTILIKRVKPFYEVLEKESAIYALLNGLIAPEYNQCPYVIYNVRFTIRKLLNELEDRHPGAKYRLFKSLQTAIKLSGPLSAKREYRRCLLCGSPASHSLCKACTYRFELGLLKQPELERLTGSLKINSELGEFLRKHTLRGRVLFEN